MEMVDLLDVRTGFTYEHVRGCISEHGKLESQRRKIDY